MGSLHCFFCNGKACKYENYQNWLHSKNNHNAIKGLYSNWITDNILATARPSSRLMQQYDIIEQFHTHNIGAIINLQQPGEHKDCGDGIINNEFSYCPEDFMRSHIYYYNFGWRDLTVPTLDHVLNIVQVINFTHGEGKKVAIHCHAGLGRTGLVIACYLQYAHFFDGEQSINMVRLHRPLSIQTSKQQAFVIEFYTYLQRLRTIFEETPSLTLEDILTRQRRYLHGAEEQALRRIPKIVHMICRRLASLPRKTLELSVTEEEAMNRTKNHKISINNGRWTHLETEESQEVLLSLLLDWLHLLKEPLLDINDIRAFFESQNPLPYFLARLTEDSRCTLHCILQTFYTINPPSPLFILFAEAMIKAEPIEIYVVFLKQLFDFKNEDAAPIQEENEDTSEEPNGNAREEANGNVSEDTNENVKPCNNNED